MDVSKMHDALNGLTAGFEGGQQLTNHSLGRRRIDDPRKHLYGEKGGELL